MTRLRLLSKPQESISLIRTLRSASFTKITFKGLIYSIHFVLLLFREGGPLPYGGINFLHFVLIERTVEDARPYGGYQSFAFCVCLTDGRGRPSLRGYVNFTFCVCCGRADPSPTGWYQSFSFCVCCGRADPSPTGCINLLRLLNGRSRTPVPTGGYFGCAFSQILDFVLTFILYLL